MASTTLENPEQFPAKCCMKEIPLEMIISVMSSRNQKRYIAQSQEQAILPQERLYCPRATCGKWIHPKKKGSRPGTQVCPYCRAKVCSNCRDFAHSPWPCSEDENVRAVLRMAKENKWQRCARCHFVVEKVDGCNHISCLCGNQFWYVDEWDYPDVQASLLT
jgi:E3 ubiquitin-protein ligase RNF144